MDGKIKYDNVSYYWNQLIAIVLATIVEIDEKEYQLTISVPFFITAAVSACLSLRKNVHKKTWQYIFTQKD